MNNGWIKLHRMILDKPLWEDQNATRVFFWILMNVDYQTGIGTFGRTQIARGTGLKNSTVYKVATRLQEKYQVLSIKSNNHFSEISVLNWAKYQQGDQEVASTVQEKEHVTSKESSTIKEYKEIKNKEIKKESIEKENLSFSYLENIPEQDVEYFVQTWDLTKSQLQIKAEQLADYCRAHNRKYKDYKAFLRNAVSKDFKVRPMSSPSTEYEFDASGVAKIKALKRQTYEIKTMDHHEMDYGEINERRNYLLNQAEELRN